MAVNGIKIAVGQRWETRGVGIATVLKRHGSAVVFYVTNGLFAWNTGPSGRFAGADDHSRDLVSLVNPTGLALPKIDPLTVREYTGGSVSYYTVHIARPTTVGREPYQAECNDIIEALGFDYAEGNAFKALWRRAAARNLGKAKAGYTDGLYDAEKVVFFGQRLVAKEKGAKP